MATTTNKYCIYLEFPLVTIIFWKFRKCIIEDKIIKILLKNHDYAKKNCYDKKKFVLKLRSLLKVFFLLLI